MPSVLRLSIQTVACREAPDFRWAAASRADGSSIPVPTAESTALSRRQMPVQFHRETSRDRSRRHRGSPVPCAWRLDRPPTTRFWPRHRGKNRCVGSPVEAIVERKRQGAHHQAKTKSTGRAYRETCPSSGRRLSSGAAFWNCCGAGSCRAVETGHPTRQGNNADAIRLLSALYPVTQNASSYSTVPAGHSPSKRTAWKYSGGTSGNTRSARQTKPKRL